MKKVMYLGVVCAILFASCGDKNGNGDPIPPDLGAILRLEGGDGGASAKNSVYVDFSTQTQVSIERTSWHLGFYCGSEFGVILNGTIGAKATLAAEDISMETIISQEIFDEYKAILEPAMGGGSLDIADEIGNDLSKTVVKEGKLYIYSAGDAKLEPYKIKVVQSANGYTLTYALWNSADVKTLEITKKPTFHFVGVSLLSNSVLNIQPGKNEWDLVWSRNTYTSAMSPGIPFVMADIVFLNRGIQAALVFTESITYGNYAVSDLASASFSSEIDVIGSDWRNGGSPTLSPSVKTDRFYVIKDIDGNHYKLRFVSMHEADGGERGYPEIEYAILN